MDSSADQPSDQEASRRIEALKPLILEAMGAHLREHGRKDYYLLRERVEFAEAIGAISGPNGDRRFWRWLGKVRKEMPSDHTRPHQGRAANQAHSTWSADEARRAAERLPVPPPASFFMRQGADGVETVRVFDAVKDAWDDLCRARALVEEAGGKPAERARQLTDNALARVKVMHTIMALLERVHEMDALHARYHQIMAFVLEDCAPYPALQEKLVRRLREANSDPISLTPPTS